MFGNGTPSAGGIFPLVVARLVLALGEEEEFLLIILVVAVQGDEYGSSWVPLVVGGGARGLLHRREANAGVSWWWQSGRLCSEACWESIPPRRPRPIGGRGINRPGSEAGTIDSHQMHYMNCIGPGLVLVQLVCICDVVKKETNEE